MAMSPNVYPQESWRDHLSKLRWTQGDHILISAPTKAGKTTLMRSLVEKRSHVVVFVSKMKDPTFEAEFKGWTILREWPKGGPKPYETRILLWPKPGKTLKETIMNQRVVFRNALDAISREGNRCVVIDESLMMNDPRLVGLGNEIGLLHYYGRSAGISMVDLTQRPSWIPKVIYSSVTHAYIARTRDAQDAKRLADMGGVDARELAANLLVLPNRHDYVYVNPQGDAPSTIINTRK